METDVIIVGAGPTGLMLAGELALAGVRTRIVERRKEANRNSRALTLHPRSVEILDLRGLAPRFLAESRTLPGWHFAGLDTPLDFSALDSRHGYTLFLPQARTEALLEERARRLGVVIDRDCEVADLTQDADGVSLELRDGNGRRTAVRARFAVGCDGARSVVRRAAGIGFPGTDETLTGVLGDFATVTADPAALRAARAAGVMVVPLEGGLTRLVYIDPERLRTPSREEVTLEEFKASLRRLCGDELAIAEPRWLSRFGNATRLAERYRNGRLLIAGDAAHIHFPAAGQGLNTGLQDAMNLGWKLAADIRGTAPASLLDSYDAERRPVGMAVTQNTEVQTLLAELALVPQYRRPATALRSLVDELLGLEQVNRLLAGRVSALSTAYPAPEGSDPLTGQRMPDLGLSRNGEATRVFDHLTDGRFLLLDLTGDDATPWPPSAARDGFATLSATAPDLPDAFAGVRQVLIRPDGHIAFATRASDADARRSACATALDTWTGARGSSTVV
ncbi:monooxygenase [Streptomyces sp. NPDC059398]|uniref:monooxygenase n=1 Tax=Streptomyces sp. NPDC059398 TaxID=3346820 RepID=UPI0036CD54DE